MSAPASAPAGSLKTTGELAADLGAPLHRVIYAIRSRKIAPARRAGRYRLYGPAELKLIVAALGETEGNAEAVGR